MSPAERLEWVTLAIKEGFITARQARRLLDGKPRPTHLRLVPNPEES
jgi:hypothetical protein